MILMGADLTSAVMVEVWDRPKDRKHADVQFEHLLGELLVKRIYLPEL